jgi:hypothetical protein
MRGRLYSVQAMSATAMAVNPRHTPRPASTGMVTRSALRWLALVRRIRARRRGSAFCYFPRITKGSPGLRSIRNPSAPSNTISKTCSDDSTYVTRPDFAADRDATESRAKLGTPIQRLLTCRSGNRWLVGSAARFPGPRFGWVSHPQELQHEVVKKETTVRSALPWMSIGRSFK